MHLTDYVASLGGEASLAEECCVFETIGSGMDEVADSLLK